jgi:hypothetical protein
MEEGSMANIVRAFVKEVLPVLVARKAAARKSEIGALKSNTARPRLTLHPRPEPYRPAPDHHLRQSHL